MLVISKELGLMRLRFARGVPIEERALKMREAFIRLGPAFVKAGQALATRGDVVPREVCVELAKMQDRMPPFSTREAMAVVEAELGAPVSVLFHSLSDAPVAAASLGQVYRGFLKGPNGSKGLEVAVKVQRPNLRPRVVMDAHVLRWAAGVIQKVHFYCLPTFISDSCRNSFLGCGC